MKKKLVVLIVFIPVLALALFSYSFFMIYKGVKTACLKAQDEYEEDCVGSLIKYIKSQTIIPSEREILLSGP